MDVVHYSHPLFPNVDTYTDHVTNSWKMVATGPRSERCSVSAIEVTVRSAFESMGHHSVHEEQMGLGTRDWGIHR